MAYKNKEFIVLSDSYCFLANLVHMRYTQFLHKSLLTEICPAQKNNWHLETLLRPLRAGFLMSEPGPSRNTKFSN